MTGGDLVYVPMPPPVAAKYLSRKSPGNEALPNEPLAIVPANVTLASLLQPSNALLPIDVTVAGMVMTVRPVQPLNASLPIDVTLAGMVMLVRPVQP